MRLVEYILASTEPMMATAKIVGFGNSQAVRLPKEFRFSRDEVEIFRRGDEIVLREKPKDLTLAFELLCSLPEFEREDAPPRDCDGL